jgi:hypothetical protein
MAKRFDAARPPDGRHVSGMMSFACPIDGAGRGTRRRHGHLDQAMDWIANAGDDLSR